MPAILFLDQQDLQRFVISPEEYIPERQANLSLEEIAAAYSPPVDHPPNPNQDPGTTPDTLDDSEPRPMETRAEVNQALEVLQLYVIQTAPNTAPQQQTASLMDDITTLTNRMWELNLKHKQQSHLDRCTGG